MTLATTAAWRPGGRQYIDRVLLIEAGLPLFQEGHEREFVTEIDSRCLSSAWSRGNSDGDNDHDYIDFAY